MKITLSLFFIALLTIAHGYEYQSTCACPAWDGSYPDSANLPQQYSTFTISDESEVISGVDHGKLVYYAGKIWLNKDFTAYRGTTLPVKSDCPSGFRIPTGDELRALLSAAKTDYASDPKSFLVNQFKMNETMNYISSEKTFPNITNGGNNDAWRFTVINFKNKLTPQIDTPATYWIPSNLKAKCVLETSANTNTANHIVNFTRPVLTDSTYELNYQKANVKASVWRVNNEILGNAQSISWTPSKAGCHVIESFLVIFGGAALRQCKIVWAEVPFGSSADTRLNVDQTQKKIFTDFTVNQVNSMHFNPSTAPIAPKVDGGSYVLFATKDSLDLYVRVLDNDGNDVVSPISLGKKGNPFDILATPWGFVSLIRDKEDTNFLYLLGSYADGSQRFLREIMNNGPNPTAIRSQLKFFSADGTQPFGMRVMFKPHNGRLAFIQGRINVIFAHYCHFGYYDNGNRNDHTGDTLVSFNEDGQDDRLISSWIASHSLVQSIVTTESKVVLREKKYR